ncbi:MAG: hypothetical protein ACYCXA_12480 [Actinomycetes bacterium]
MPRPASGSTLGTTDVDPVALPVLAGRLVGLAAGVAQSGAVTAVAGLVPLLWPAGLGPAAAGLADGVLGVVRRLTDDLATDAERVRAAAARYDSVDRQVSRAVDGPGHD